MKKLLENKWVRWIGFPLLGALGGYAYYYFIGCSGGNTCPISSNPLISTGYGALIGLILAFPGKKQKQQ